MSKGNTKNGAAKPQRKRYALGIALLIIATILWALVFAVPFAPISTSAKAAIITALIVLGEILFWVGALLVGAQAMKSLGKKRSSKK